MEGILNPQDVLFMRRALVLAEKGQVGASPNPLVGCVISRGGRAVGEGWHARFGGPHAETVALARAGGRARGATVYLNLEPCSHWGKTPPCADALVRAGVRRVVFALRDPDKRVSGRGFSRLRRAGVQVATGLLEKEARFLNRAFIKFHTRGLPYVIWKTAQTLDGKIRSSRGVSKWITSPEARRLGHGLRASCDAILVGGETVRRDNPALTSHGQGPDPFRLVVSRSLDLDPQALIFNGVAPAVVITSGQAPRAAVKKLEKAGAFLFKFDLKKSSFDFSKVLQDIAKIGITRILLESGGSLAWSMLHQGLVDEAYCFVAPSFLGGQKALTSLEGEGWALPGQGARLRDIEILPAGRDFLIHGFLNEGILCSPALFKRLE